MDARQLEYQECNATNRFIVGIRFTYFASFMTLFVILMGGYHVVWTSSNGLLKTIQPYLLFVTACFGFIVTCAAAIIEKRNTFLYRACDKRAAFLEKQMKIEKGVKPEETGIRQYIADKGSREWFWCIPMTYTVAIAILYVTIAVIWYGLMIYSGYLIGLKWF